MSQSKPPSNARVIGFIVVLSFVCALILSLLASALRGPQELAQELDRSSQMLMAARIISHEGFLQVRDEDQIVMAQLEPNGALIPSKSPEFPSNRELFDLYQERIVPMLVDRQGNLKTFEEAGVDLNDYINKNRKTGFYRLPLMLVYKILPNPEEGAGTDPIGWIIPINGYGLWDAIYGYLAIESDGDTVIGISWYEQKETPGLGAEITAKWWQDQFHGKLIFEQGPDGKTDLETAPLGLTVVRGQVQNVIGDRPRAKSAVDGIPGATLTGNGVTQAFRDVLAPYRPFFIKLNAASKEQS